MTDDSEPRVASVVLGGEVFGARVSEICSEQEIAVSDVFLVPGDSFQDYALNHPDRSVRDSFAELLDRTMGFAVAVGSPGVTVLPGVIWPTTSRDESIALAANELSQHAIRAGALGLQLSFEPHRWSVTSSPEAAWELLHAAPDASVTLDYSHFVSQGYAQDEVEALLERSRHVHARSARRGRLHTTLERNEIDFGRILAKLERISYRGRVALEHEAVSPDRSDADVLDVLSETLRLREHLVALGTSR